MRHVVIDSEASRIAWNVSGKLLPDFALGGMRAQLFRLLGFHVKEQTSILGHVKIIGPKGASARLRIGRGCIIAPGVAFGLDGEITIGQNVSVGPNVVFTTATHALGRSERRMSFKVIAKPIVIEDGVWIGMGVLVLPGVTIGAGSVVSAGSVIASDIPPNSLVSGNPAELSQKLPL